MTTLTETRLTPEAIEQTRRSLQSWRNRWRMLHARLVIRTLNDHLLRDIGLDAASDRCLSALGLRREKVGRFFRRL
jgi:uncharacterized protein YjiS (DUF1127 family)